MSAFKTENVVTTSSGPAAPPPTSSSPFGNGAFQLPINMSSSSPIASTISTTTTNRNNVSVTNIKCEVEEAGNANGNSGAYFTGGGMPLGVGIRIPVPKAEDSDSETELTNIENLKVTRRATSSTAAVGSGSQQYQKNGPRPMSWEGELSEPEAELMETENSLSNDINVAAVSVIKSEASTTTPHAVAAHTAAAVHNLLHQHRPLEATASSSTSSSSASLNQVLKSDLDPMSREAPEASTLERLVGIGGLPGALYTSPAAGCKLKLGPTQSDPINLKYEPLPATSSSTTEGLNSPLLNRNKASQLPHSLPANPSPDSAIHSVYTHSSPSQSPLTSRHAPYTPSLSRNNSDASHSSCYSYSSEFSPTHSPIQGRHAAPSNALYGSYNGSLHHSVLYRPISASLDAGLASAGAEAQNLSMDAQSAVGGNAASSQLSNDPSALASSAAGISRQQLINSPCPICGDKISGFHYGIFSCESCKGFFKRTVQNRKNYVCVRGGPCPVSIATRKKCPACRFEKCLQKGMKLEAIREDRTRGGRSTYQCSYTLPNSMLSPLLSPDQQQQQQQQHQQNQNNLSNAVSQHQQQQQQQLHQNAHGLNGYSGVSSFNPAGVHIKNEPGELGVPTSNSASSGNTARTGSIPVLLQEIMDVEHLWQYNTAELARLNQPIASSAAGGTESGTTPATAAQMTNPLLASAGLSNGDNTNPDLIAHLCNVADHRLYKIVKWCKSLPLFKNISIDDQICLLINSWCELLLFSCCYRSIDTEGEIKMSQGKKISLAQAKTNGLQACIERMLNLTDHLRRLRVDRYEYVAMKVIVLLQSDTSELQEPVKVRECQEKALQSLQAYTLAHYPDTPSKFGELLLRIPDLQRTCQLGKEMLTLKSRDGGGGDFNLLMELLRGEH